MTRLTKNTKMVILELHLNSDWTALEVINLVAKALNIEAGEQEDVEWVRLMHIRTVNQEKANAK